MGLKAESKTRHKSFAEILADRVCSGHNQHAIILFEGKTGMGKSLATIRLCYECSLLFAKRLGGRPEDYFNFLNIGVMSKDEILRIAKNIKKFGIYILDDVGAEGLNARKWQSEQNEAMTKLLQTFRSNNNILIVSSPDRGFVDKIARNLLHYKVVMEIPHFDQGFTLGKLSTVKKIYTKDGGNNLYPFLRKDGSVFNYIKFKLPPDHIRIPYEAKRAKIEREMNTASIEVIEKDGNDKESKAIEKAKEESMKLIHAKIYKSEIANGLKAHEAMKKATDITGLEISQATIQRTYNKYVSECA